MARHAPAPGRLRRRGRSGVGLFFCVVLAVASGACERGDTGPRSIDIDGGAVELPRGAEVHTVRLRAAMGRGFIEPDTVRARPGDAVRFVAGDDRGHAVAFESDRLDPGAERFLFRTGQLRGAPLVRAETAWIVDLTDAPPGRYPFRCLNTGSTGVLFVESSDDG